MGGRKSRFLIVTYFIRLVQMGLWCFAFCAIVHLNSLPLLKKIKSITLFP